MADAPERICATSGVYCDYAQDWSSGEWAPVQDGDVFDEHTVEYIRADILEAKDAKIARLREALEAADALIETFGVFGRGAAGPSELSRALTAYRAARAALAEDDTPGEGEEDDN
jgi:hypothetical protein